MLTLSCQPHSIAAATDTITRREPIVWPIADSVFPAARCGPNCVRGLLELNLVCGHVSLISLGGVRGSMGGCRNCCLHSISRHWLGAHHRLHSLLRLVILRIVTHVEPSIPKKNKGW